MNIGLIGCGNISDQYLTNLPRLPGINVRACADIVMERAKARALEYNIPEHLEVDELLERKDIELVVNLTIPKAHGEISTRILNVGKHAYSEKPLAIHRSDGAKILESANNMKMMAGCAPDTFLGAGIQTCRNLIDKGAIGEPIAATAFMVNHGHEHWHPDPAFYYEVGGGPMLDMGPYYLTALINLLGPINSVSGMTRKTFGERTITSESLSGTKIDVEIPTHVAASLRFVNGAIGTIITSFDIWGSQLPRIEIYGTEGSISVPDPNTFEGPVSIQIGYEDNWKPIDLTHPIGGRGLGVADMVAAVKDSRRPRADISLAYHVLDVMEAIHESSNQENHISIESLCRQPPPIKPEWVEGDFTE